MLDSARLGANVGWSSVSCLNSSNAFHHLGIVTLALQARSIATRPPHPDRQVSPGEDSPSERHRRQRVRRLPIGQLSSLTRGDERNFLKR
jgi:hypothetical protein